MMVESAIPIDGMMMPVRLARLGANGISASAISALMAAQTMIWVVMPCGRQPDGFTKVPAAISGKPQARKQVRFEDAIDHADQERDKADQRDQRADLLAESDLILG